MSEGCWICDNPDVVFIDVLDMRWCNECYYSIFLGEPPQSQDCTRPSL